MVSIENPMAELLANGIISVGIALAVGEITLLIKWSAGKSLVKVVLKRRKA